MSRKQFGIGAMAAVLVLVAGGCGSSPAASNTGSGSGTAKTPPSPVRTGTATVAGKSEVVLTNGAGMTLYYFTKDTATSSACTGQCASIWPPVLVKTSHVSAPSGLSGTLAVVKDQNGEQVAYDGHLLYTYSADTAAGQASGQGLKNLWWVATPSLKAAGASTGSSGY